jgi:hypothetical protein
MSCPSGDRIAEDGARAGHPPAPGEQIGRNGQVALMGQPVGLALDRGSCPMSWMTTTRRLAPEGVATRLAALPEQLEFSPPPSGHPLTFERPNVWASRRKGSGMGPLRLRSSQAIRFPVTVQGV